jgi:hypothetical protein
MDGDLIIVAGLAMLMLSIPSAVSAYADGRRPWVALVVMIAGAGVLIWGWGTHPADMSLAEVPHVIIRVLARVIP